MRLPPALGINDDHFHNFRNLKTEIRRSFTLCFVWVWNLVYYSNGRP